MWAEAGQPYGLFWELTLREVSMILEGVNSRVRRERNEAISLAWHIEAFSRVKKLPKLESLLNERKPNSRQMTPEQIEATLRDMFAKRRR